MRQNRQKIRDAEVKAHQEWNNKPQEEQIADARYLLSTRPDLAQKVLRDKTYWITEALEECKRDELENEALARKWKITPKDTDAKVMQIAMMIAELGE